MGDGWGKVLGRIGATAAPVYVTMIASSAAAIVDAALLGRHDTASLAAFAVTVAVFNPVMATIAGVQRGVIPFAASHKEDREALVRVVRGGMWLGYAVGAVGAVAVGCVPLIAVVAGTPGATVDRLGVFPLLLVGSVVATALGSTATSVLIGLGQAKKVMRVGLVTTATGVVLSLALVRGAGPVPPLGLTGAGVAMLAATVVGRVAAQLALRGDPAVRGLRLRPGRPDAGEITRLARVGVPLAGTVLVKFVVMGVLTFAAARIDTASAAVQAVCVSLSNVLYTAAVAVGQATVPLIAVFVRDHRVVEARRTVQAGLIVALGAVAALGAALLALRHQVVPVFSADPSVRGRVLDLLLLVLAAVATDSLQAVAGFGLVGLKRTVPSLVSTVICFGLLALAAVPLAESGGLVALWLALIAANLLQAAAKTRSFYHHTGRRDPAPTPARRRETAPRPRP